MDLGDQKRVWNDFSSIVISNMIKWDIKKISVIFNMKSIFMGSAIVFSGFMLKYVSVYVIRIKYCLSHRNNLTIKIKKYFLVVK